MFSSFSILVNGHLLIARALEDGKCNLMHTRVGEIKRNVGELIREGATGWIPKKGPGGQPSDEV